MVRSFFLDDSADVKDKKERIRRGIDWLVGWLDGECRNVGCDPIMRAKTIVESNS